MQGLGSFVRRLFSSLSSAKLQNPRMAVYQVRHVARRLFLSPISSLSSTTLRGVMSDHRHNFPEENEAAINKHINNELNASYVYHSMAIYFQSCDVALKGFARFFRHRLAKKRLQAEKLMIYQYRRGGTVKLQDIQSPATQEWKNGQAAMEEALKLEEDLNKALLTLHGTAEKNNDPAMAHFVADEFLDSQVVAIHEIHDHVSNLERLDAGLGEYMYDQESLAKEEH